ncbi:MAG: SUMF1/EgtB/PvdO family nonheme iron enzyme [Proteobacteria bacterium]|nr:SUMF1/EgtB/PvdO family nonheme iron enzyme [Pseudomonadota bacterium]
MQTSRIKAKVLKFIFSGSGFVLLILLPFFFIPSFIWGQEKKDVLVIFEVEIKGITPKPIQEGVLTDALTAEFAEAGNYNLVDRDTLYYYFKQIQEKTKKPCSGPECLADLAANLDADLFVKAEVSKAGKECRFSVKLYKRKPQTVLYFVDQTKIESCSCQAAGLEKAAKAIGRKLTGREGSEKLEGGKEINPTGTKGGPMVLIPAGEFMMGCNESVDNQCREAEKPFHKVSLDAYYIDKYEVTVDQYAQCVQAGKCSKPADGRDCNWGISDRGNHPINCVDWNQAGAYCGWAGKRLPREAEWEKAARGRDGRIYPWGNEKATCEYAVFEENYPNSGCGRYSTWPVGSKIKDVSPYGVMDMAGNVGEWINDALNSRGSSSGPRYSLRGGYWFSDADILRTSFRIVNSLGPSFQESKLGFRCVRDAK